MRLNYDKKPTGEQIDQALRNSLPEVPSRQAKYALPQRPMGEMPKPELECPDCREQREFETDGVGRLVQVCLCGRSYVPQREAPEVLRKPTGKRIVSHACENAPTIESDVCRSSGEV